MVMSAQVWNWEDGGGHSALQTSKPADQLHPGAPLQPVQVEACAWQVTVVFLHSPMSA